MPTSRASTSVPARRSGAANRSAASAIRAVRTGAHLHYEVIYRGHTVNPINYFRRDMSTEDFERIIRSARETTYEPND